MTRKSDRRWHGSKGAALLGVLILSFAMAIVGLSFLSMAGQETKQSQQHVDSQRAFWLAEAGNERALRNMVERFRPPESEEVIYSEVAGPDGGTYTVSVLVDSASIYSADKAFVLQAVGSSRGIERRIRQRIRMLSFSRYAYFTEDERGAGGYRIWFASADDIYGPVHTNGVFHMYGSPQFHGPVTTASDHMVGYPNYNVYGPDGWPIGGNNPSFDEGFELNAPFIPLPTQTLDLRGEAIASGLYLTAASDVQLGRTGALGAGVDNPGWLRHRNTPPAADTTWTSVEISTLPSRVVYCEQELQVHGVLDGELTLSGRRDIVIIDDLVYAGSNAAGTPQPGCDDLLGIVAEDNIIYDFSPATVDLKVNAVLMALDTSITAEDYNNYVTRGTLTIWGGLIQRFRGPVGLIGGGSIVSGYRKDYHYDTRVTARTPPAFPLTGVYEKVAWTETWDAQDPFN